MFDGVLDVAGLEERLAGSSRSAATPAGELVEIPVRYDGPDLAAGSA